MNENLNLEEILKDCPIWAKLYSTVHGNVRFTEIKRNHEYPVKYITSDGSIGSVTAQGLLCSNLDGECTLFPSKDQRDWSKFKVKKPKFDPKTLKPFDKILARNGHSENWNCDIFSNIYDNEPYKYNTISNYWKYCIPYNEETKHLLGTKDEAPEYYRHWEE